MSLVESFWSQRWRRCLLSLTALLVVAASSCGDGDRSANPFAGASPLTPPSSDEIAEAVAAFQPGASTDHTFRSAVDFVSPERRSTLTTSAIELAGLLPSPDAIGAFHLGDLQVDDPNGDGRIDGNWYPPRVLRQECSAKVDAAPGPYAVAVYVPGSETLGKADPTAAFSLLSAAIAVQVQVQVFDDASQRDAYLDATVEFLRDPTFTCGGKEASMQTYEETQLRTSRVDALVFEAQPVIVVGGVRALAAVGDRVLLSVSMTNHAVDSLWAPEDLERWVGPVFDVAVERLEATELP